MLMVLLLIVFLASACSGISIESARQLSASGRNVAVQARQNVLVSDHEYLRARDSEALLHGFSGTTGSNKYTEILKLYDNIHQELARRSVVFDKLADLYDAFGNLAGFDAGDQTETALGNLGGAIEEYAKQIKQPSLISSETTAVIARIGGLIATQIQKAKIKEASIQIRARVGAFLKLLENPLVRGQVEGFRKVLISDVKAALSMLWDAGVYDPKPLLDDLGAPGGLAAQKDAAQVVKNNQKLREALGEVLDKRLTRQTELIEEGYNASLKALVQLMDEHKKLEEGTPLDLTRLRAVVAQLRGIVVLLVKAKTGGSTSQ